jgi:hypothetical protein
MMQRHTGQMLIGITIGICIAVAGWQIGTSYRDAQITRAAMENGYVQEVVDGQVVWRKQGATVGEWLRWIVENVKELF